MQWTTNINFPISICKIFQGSFMWMPMLWGTETLGASLHQLGWVCLFTCTLHKKLQTHFWAWVLNVVSSCFLNEMEMNWHSFLGEGKKKKENMQPKCRNDYIQPLDPKSKNTVCRLVFASGKNYSFPYFPILEFHTSKFHKNYKLKLHLLKIRTEGKEHTLSASFHLVPPNDRSYNPCWMVKAFPSTLLCDSF